MSLVAEVIDPSTAEQWGVEPVDDAKVKAAATYNAAAEHFDVPALSLWDRFGQATVDRLSARSRSLPRSWLVRCVSARLSVRW